MCAKRSSAMAIFLGNCKVEFPGGVDFERKAASIEFNIPQCGSIRISAESEAGQYVVLNPKNIDDEGNTILQQVLELYKKELPSMSFSAGSTKRSPFLKKSVTNGKYCTLTFRRNEQVLGAMTYQTVPFNTCYAEIPLAAVDSDHQRQGLGTNLYAELRRRLHDVGVSIIYCWADVESKDFWCKQGFEVLGETDCKGTLPEDITVKPALEKAMCNPGNAFLMVSHLTGVKNNPGAFYTSSTSISAEKPSPAPTIKTPGATDVKSTDYDIEPFHMYPELQDVADQVAPLAENTEPLSNVALVPVEVADSEEEQEQSEKRTGNSKSRMTKAAKKRRRNSYNSKKKSAKKYLKGCSSQNPSETRLTSDGQDFEEVNSQTMAKDSDIQADKDVKNMAVPAVMFMNMGDREPRRAQLTKFVEDLGGSVTIVGTDCTHLLTLQVRPTETFCNAISAGAWILSPEWLRESVRIGSFADPASFILKDDSFKQLYKMEIEDAMKRAKERPRSLFCGYTACVTPNVRQCFSRLIEFSGGKVVKSLPEVSDDKLFVVTCQMDGDSSMVSAARKQGVRHVFDTNWIVTSLLKQQLSTVQDVK